MSGGHSAENDTAAYLDYPSPNPLICRRCGALVDRAFLAEHDSHHTRAASGQPAGKSEGLDDAGPVPCCSSPRHQARVLPPGSAAP